VGPPVREVSLSSIYTPAVKKMGPVAGEMHQAPKEVAPTEQGQSVHEARYLLVSALLVHHQSFHDSSGTAVTSTPNLSLMKCRTLVVLFIS